MARVLITVEGYVDNLCSLNAQIPGEKKLRGVTSSYFEDIIFVNHDTISFQELYSRYAEDVYRFSFWLTGDADDAKDITSETFVRVWTAKTETRMESVKAYLFAIARNLWLQDKRRMKRMTPIDEEIGDATGRPDDLAEARFDLDLVLKALQTLPEIDRAVLIMRVEDGLSYEEIAAATGLSVSSVKVKVFRARLKINSLVKME